MEGIKNALQKTLARHGISQQVAAADVCRLFSEAAAVYLPPEIRTHVAAVSFRAGTLKIAVKSSNFAQALHWRETQICAAINKKAASRRVERIKIVVGLSDETSV
jgi:predicted nucleic acid-binding Zn ribbon protein